MAKKSKKRLAHHERGQSGCMSGFIGMFDFRQGRSTRRLLSDKKHGSSRHTLAGTGSAKGRDKLFSTTDENLQGSDPDVDNFSDGGEMKTLKSGISRTSVKKLIEEDMSNEQQTDERIPNIAMEQIRSDPDNKRSARKNLKQTKKTCKVVSDIHVRDTRTSANLEKQEEYNQPNSAKKLSHMDLSSLLEEFCSKIQHSQELHLHCESKPDCRNVQECTDFVKHTLQEKLSEAAETFLNQKLIDTKQLTENGEFHQSRQLVDALEILNSNKELLLKLLEESKSLQVKHIQDLQVTSSEKVNQDNSLGCGKKSEGISNVKPAEELVHRKEVQKHHIHNFFKKRDKSPKKSSSQESDDSQGSNQIVVLRPMATKNSVHMAGSSSPPQPHNSFKNQGWSGKFQSQFSLSEIKRKLKNSIGEDRKDRHWVSVDGTRLKVRDEHQNLGDSGKVDPKNIAGKELRIKRKTKPFDNGDEEEKIEKPTPCNPSTAQEVGSTRAASRKNLTITTAGYPKPRESNIYIEAKKHLEEILTGGDEDGGLSHQQSPKTLGRILSLPDYSSTSVYSPGRDGEHGFVTAQMRFSPNGNFRIINENIWRFKPDNNISRPSPSRKSLEIQQDRADTDDSRIELQESDSKPDSCEKLLPSTDCDENISSSKEDSSPKGDLEIMDDIDVASIEEENLSDGSSQSNSITPIIDTGATEIMEQEEPYNCSTPESLQVDRPPSSLLSSSSSSSLLLEKVEPLESISELPERPSPISVLEPFFDDVNSSTTTTPRAELQKQQLHFDTEEDDCSTVIVTTSDLHNCQRPCSDDKIPPFEYVTAVLQATNLNWEELFGKYRSSELLLNPSLFYEVEVTPSQHSSDNELLFDCINEVLGELYERYFGSSPWVAFVNPDIRPAPMGKSIIHEVWEGIKWNLLPQFTPPTLDGIIGKDMEKARAWIDFRPDAEVLGYETADDILDDLLDDAIFDLCSN